MKKNLKISALVSVFVIMLTLLAIAYFFIGKNHQQKEGEIVWGVDFSQMQSEYLKLDWKKNYLALMQDLGVKNIKLHTTWDWVEGKRDDFYFNDIDWQISQAEKNKVKIIYVLGMKTGRWPECHTPSWAKNLSEKEQKDELLKYIAKVVLRYKNSKSIMNWQLENEPFFKFGECPDWYYKNDNFLRSEIALVRTLDPSRKIIISDSGEQSNWFEAAKNGDIVGITMYRNTWPELTDTFGLESYSFLNPSFYYNKSKTVKDKFGKNVICIELQAEPWASKPLGEAPIEEQLKSINEKMFMENIEFAKKSGLEKFYLWGAEWWYWMKEKQGHPEIWNKAKELFKN